MNTTYSCPSCENDINLPRDVVDAKKGDSVVECDSCHDRFRVSHDADCVNGRWVDATSLIKV